MQVQVQAQVVQSVNASAITSASEGVNAYKRQVQECKRKSAHASASASTSASASATVQVQLQNRGGTCSSSKCKRKCDTNRGKCRRERNIQCEGDKAYKRQKGWGGRAMNCGREEV